MLNLTTKELSGIEDQLTCEMTMIQKYKAYSNQVQDVSLKTKFNEIAQKHQQHYDKLYSLLG